MGWFERFATVTVSTKRSPVVVSGKRGEMVTNLTGLKIVPIQPYDSRTPRIGFVSGMEGQAAIRLETYTAKQSHTDSSVVVNQLPDIREGDMIVDGSSEYRVVYVSNWPTTNYLDPFLFIGLEDEKV
jgi:hypothetical protein